MSQWDSSAPTLPNVPAPAARATPSDLPVVPAPVSAVDPYAPVGASPQPVVPPTRVDHPAQMATPAIPAWVKVMAVVVTVLKLLPLAAAAFFVVVGAAIFDVAEIGIFVTLILVALAMIVGFQAYAALANRRRALQVIAGLLALVDMASLIANLQGGSLEVVLLAAVGVTFMQFAVFIGSLVNPDA